MDEIPNVPDNPQIDKGGNLWKTLLFTFLGTTMSILLTFGTSQLVAQHRRAQERHLTALMVMGNIEKFASTMENFSEKMAVRDTFAAYLLSIPMDSLDNPKSENLLNKFLTLNYPLLKHDKSVEKVFSNSIDTWKNTGNFQFIEGVGQMFSQMDYWEELHNGLLDEIQQEITEINKNPDAHPGRTSTAKLMRDPNFRRILGRFHNLAIQERYVADHMRYINRYLMKLMDISEEEVMAFAHKDEDNTEAIVGEPKKRLSEFVTPELDIDSLPALEDWMGE
jgi:hypothetical protein